MKSISKTCIIICVVLTGILLPAFTQNLKKNIEEKTQDSIWVDQMGWFKDKSNAANYVSYDNTKWINSIDSIYINGTINYLRPITKEMFDNEFFKNNYNNYFNIAAWDPQAKITGEITLFLKNGKNIILINDKNRYERDGVYGLAESYLDIDYWLIKSYL